MGLIGINPVQPRQKMSALERVALGIDIANKTLGTGIDIAKFFPQMSLMKAEQQKAESEAQLAPYKAMQEQEKVNQEHIKTGVDVLTKTRAPTEAEKGTGISLGTYGERIPISEQKATPAEDIAFRSMLETHDISKEHNPGAEPYTVGHQTFWLAPKAEVDPKKIALETQLSNKFDAETKPFQIQSRSYAAGEALSKLHTSAADLGLLANFWNVINPRERGVTGEDVAAAEANGTLPQEVSRWFKRLDATGTLPSEDRPQILDAMRTTYKTALDQHQARERHVRQISKQYGVNADNIITPIQAAIIEDTISAHKTKGLSILSDDQILKGAGLQ